ncbi:fatty-acid peroxygenase [Mariniluteicoccus endophyticus]
MSAHHVPLSSAHREPSGLGERALDLLRDGYRFADVLRARATTADAHHAVPFRLLGQDALLVRGLEGVRFFYDTAKMKRDGAMPTFIKAPLFGSAPVHSLDGEEHRHRKSLFIDAVRPESVRQLALLVAEQWEAVLQPGTDVEVYDTAVQAYGRAVLAWAGVTDLTSDEAVALSRDLALIVDTFGTPGLPWVRGMAARRRTNRWAARAVAAARSGGLTPAHGSALRIVADHRDLDGNLLDEQIAGIELHNIVRPTIAVCRFAAFLALALIDHPQWRERLRAEAAERNLDPEAPQARAFAQEVRRFYPFVPMLPARAREDTEFAGHPVKKGQRVLIDVLGTNTDPELWDHADEFWPERFLDEPGLDHAEHFIPQGGGSAETGHRCPGEPIAVELLTVTALALASREWEVPRQNLGYPITWLPTRPRDGVRLRLR